MFVNSDLTDLLSRFNARDVKYLVVGAMPWFSTPSRDSRTISTFWWLAPGKSKVDSLFPHGEAQPPVQAAGGVFVDDNECDRAVSKALDCR